MDWKHYVILCDKNSSPEPKIYANTERNGLAILKIKKNKRALLLMCGVIIIFRILTGIIIGLFCGANSLLHIE